MTFLYYFCFESGWPLLSSPNRSLKYCSICNKDRNDECYLILHWIFLVMQWIKLSYQSWCVQKSWEDREDIWWFGFIVDHCLPIYEGNFHLLMDSVFISRVSQNSNSCFHILIRWLSVIGEGLTTTAWPTNLRQNTVLGNPFCTIHRSPL